MTETQHNPPTDPTRIRAFAVFFKNYMSISSLVTAALPIPVTSLKLIPAYGFQIKLLSVYTPLFCFLILAFIFYNRDKLARRMFAYHLVQDTSSAASEDFVSQAQFAEPEVRERLARTREKGVSQLPLRLIMLSLIAAVAYIWTLTSSVANLPLQPPPSESQVFQYLLTSASPLDVHPTLQVVLLVEYIAIFLAAEAAFVLMAIKEYLQDVLKLEDVNLII